jgi:RHS repeat-associated protein
VFDPETGLHYNRQRYYDPQHGQYLTPDPLGTPDGPNPYAYVAFNPLTNIDPDGLVLFAFDGTGNDLSDPNALSNVANFRSLYQDNSRGRDPNYITGVGTLHTDPAYGNIVPREDSSWRSGFLTLPDRGGNWTGPERIARMIQYFNDEAELFTDNSALMDVDIIGFSRGAAQARDFANRINAATRNGQYTYTITENGRSVQRCQMINFRFMGLWDTVLSSNSSGLSYNLGTVAGFQHVAHAVALNEYRSGSTLAWAQRNTLPNRDHWGAFPLESISGGTIPVGQTRIERGFIGAHSDIGGGYGSAQGGGDLARVALAWMIEQARDAGVTMRDGPSSIVANPVLHDQSNAIHLGDPRTPGVVRNPSGSTVSRRAEDRDVRGGIGGTTQRTMRFDNNSLTNAGTHEFINYRPRDRNAYEGSPQLAQSTGTVDMRRYLVWLRDNGYNIGNLQVQ